MCVRICDARFAALESLEQHLDSDCGRFIKRCVMPAAGMFVYSHCAATLRGSGETKRR